jgi:uncharacterized membrane protein
MAKIAAGYVILVAGFLFLLVAMSGLYHMGILGTLFGFMVVIPALTFFVYMPAKNLINDGRKKLQ